MKILPNILGFQINSNMTFSIYFIWTFTFFAKLLMTYAEIINLDKNSKVEGYLTNDSWSYYSTRISSTIKDLQIRVYPKEGTLTTPDLFVSLKESPTGPSNSDYYSVMVSEDYVLIPKDKLIKDKLVYFSVHCERECYYFTEVKYDDDLSIDMDNYSSFMLESDSDLVLKFKSVPEGWELNAYCPQMAKFKAYLQKEKIPSSSDTLNLYPTFIGGYGIELTPQSEGFCKDCTYYLLIVAEDSKERIDNSEIVVSLTRVTRYEYLDERFPVFNVVSKDHRRCFLFTVPIYAMIDNVITTLTVFSGTAKLDINPGKYVEESQAKFHYAVPISLVKKNTPTDFNLLDFRDIYYCVTGLEDSSFMLKVIMESHTEITQTYNFLIDGVEVPGYLPGRNITRYRVVDFGHPRNTTITLKAAEGKPKLYGYFCKSIYSCYIDNNAIKNNTLNKDIIPAEEYSGDSYLQTVYANDYGDKCGQDAEKNGCGLNAVVFCSSVEECIFDISFNFEHSIVILKEKQVISAKDADFYKIKITQDVQRLTIILNSISGETTLNVSRTANFPKSAEERQSLAKKNSPDVITFIKKRDGDLKGEFFITIYASTFASYSIYYYSETQQQLEDPSTSAKQLFNQDIIKDFLYTDATKYKVYSYVLDYTEKTKEDIRIIITPIIGDFEIYVYLPNSKISYNPDKNTFSGYKWSTYDTLSDNEIIISKNDKDYIPFGKYLIVVALLENKFYSEASYYLGLSDETNGLNIQANIPVVFVLKHGIWDIQLFHYQLTENQNFILNLNVFSGAITLDIHINETFIDSIEDCIGDCVINKQWMDFKKYCTTKICNIKLTLIDRSVETNSFYSSSKFYLIVKSDNKEAELIYPGFKKHGEVNHLERNYYYAFIPKDSSAIATVYFTDADGEVFAKLVDYSIKNKNEINSSMPVKASEQNVFFSKKYWNSELKLTHVDTSICQEFCTLLITVYGKNDFYNNKNSMGYDISLSNQVIEISINKPNTSSITAGEYQYYRITFDPVNGPIKNLIFTLTNSEGDCDLFVTYGDRLPRLDDFDFASETFETEIIQLNQENKFFKDSGKASLEGTYTIGVYSYVNSTYTLFASPTNEKLLPVEDYYPSSCNPSEKEYCLFNYMLDWMDYAINDAKGSLKSIIFIDFTYGTGVALAKLVPRLEPDFKTIMPQQGEPKVFDNKADRNYINLDFKVEDYPEVFNMTKLNKEYSEAKQSGNQQNLEKADSKNINLKYLSKLRPIVIVKVTCTLDCAFSLHTATRYFDNEFYLDPYFDNLVYMPNNYNTTLYYYNYGEGKTYDLQFEEVKGTTNFELYSAKDAKQIEAFKTKNTDQEKVIHEAFSINTLSNESKKKIVKISKKNFDITQVNSFSQTKEDSIFFVRVLVHHKWQKLQSGADNVFPVNFEAKTNSTSDNDNFYFVYFDFLDSYDSVTINFQCKFDNECIIVAYGKYLTFDVETTKKDSINLNTVASPSPYAFHFKSYDMHNNNSGYMKIDKPHTKENERSIGLISVILTKTKQYFDDENELRVTLTPSSNKRTFTFLEPGKVIYAIQEEKKSLVGEVEVVDNIFDIYEIIKNSDSDNTLSIFISTCFGEIQFRVYDTPYFDVLVDKPMNVDYFIIGGKNLIRIKNVTGNIYVAVSASSYEATVFCNTAKTMKNPLNCTHNPGKAAQYSISYYSSKEDYKVPTSFMNTIAFSHENGDYQISFKPISERIKHIADKYMLFVTEDVTLLRKFASPCFLGLTPGYKDITKEIQSQSLSNNIYTIDLDMNAGTYYINIAVIAKNGEIYVYTPVQVIIEKARLLPLIAIIAIVVLSILAGIFFFKYRKTKTRLDLERQDISNMASTNQFKTDKELKEMKEEKEREQMKYSTLAIDSSTI